jgi:hypothetical protein
MRFVGRVGGVSFEATMNLKQFAGGAVDLTYDATRPDGSRVILTLGSVRESLSLWDWQARPIAEFADSKYTAAVSLFGEGPNREQFFYIDYHPAFFDRLLGLRLLQADIMLIDPLELRQPPRPSGANPQKAMPTGGGEPSFDEAKSRQAAIAIRQLMQGQSVGSWVLTDVDSDVVPTVEIQAGRVGFRAKPYYFFWRSAEADPTSDQLVRGERLLAQMEMARSRGDVAGVQKTATALLSLREDLTRVQRVDAPTNALRARQDLVRDLNPQVHEAAYRTALYSALFRGVKQHSPSVWRRFLESVDKASVPVVKVPNEWEKK